MFEEFKRHVKRKQLRPMAGDHGQTVCEWALDELVRLTAFENAALEVLGTVPGINFLEDRRRLTFQMQGQYDGAMSEACKAGFADEQAAVEALLERLREAATAAGGDDE